MKKKTPVPKYPLSIAVALKVKTDCYGGDAWAYEDIVGEIELQYADPKRNKTLRFSHMGLYGKTGRGRLTYKIPPRKMEPAEVAICMSDLLALCALRINTTIINDYRDEKNPSQESL